LTSFVLVHGAWHDGRTWDRLRLILDRRGCRSTAVDLPIEDVTIDASGYAREIAAAIAELGREPPVVVGHSMAGIALPLVPAITPVRRVVFVAALIPEPGQRMADIQGREEVLGDTRAVARDARGRSFWTSAEAAIEILYHDCEPAVARPARRPPAATSAHAARPAVPPEALPGCANQLHRDARRPNGQTKMVTRRRPTTARRRANRAPRRTLADARQSRAPR
jgi:pimeloyl-ACP methyl ester carboxylesterase